MKINEEQFNKLKQLDRIEFRQKAEILNKNNDSIFLSMINAFITLTMFLFIADLWVNMQTGNTFPINTYYNFSMIIRYGLVTAIILDIIYIIRRIKRKNKLINEFFKIGVKK